MAEIWGVAIAAGAAVVGGYMEGEAADEAADKSAKQSALNTELGFQRQAWLDQQQRKWQLEDRQYKEDSVAGFRNLAPESSKTFNGSPTPIPQRTSTDGLTNWNPNVKGSIPFGGVANQQPTQNDIPLLHSARRRMT